jgi:CBS domain-containing protein
MNIEEIMAKPVITVKEDTTLEQTARTLLDNNIGCVPVVDSEGNLTGIITESDFAAKEKYIPFSSFSAPKVLGHWLPIDGIEGIYEAARNLSAKEIMTRSVITIEKDDAIEEAVELMLENKINRIPVVQDGKPIGIIARRDLLRLLTGKIG